MTSKLLHQTKNRIEPRRVFLKRAAQLGAASALAGTGTAVLAASTTMPFANGKRDLVAYPQKRPLIVLTSRPPQLETPFEVFDHDVITPNDAFFVRYHWSGIPTDIDAHKFRLNIRGNVDKPYQLTLAEIKHMAAPVSIVAVNQCSGNSRGHFDPRVNGGQLSNGAMGNAKWTGVSLKTVLERAGVKAGSMQVSFNGLDVPPIGDGPDFVKALNLDHAMDGEVILAWAMNGEDLPMLNGYPLRLIVPGFYGTYWVKHVSDIFVTDKVFDGFWMASAYRIPDNDCACVEPGTTPTKTVPIGRFNVRSFITNLSNGQQIKAGPRQLVRGIAFDGGSGIAQVAFSADGGSTWKTARLGKDLGRYSFREWSIVFTPAGAGTHQLKVRAVNHKGETQPMTARWNAPGYMRNVVETTTITAV